MAGEGQILRDARVRKGWSIVQAEDATKIRVRYLEALEAENYSILPGSTYVKGFLRTYAKHLELDPEEIINLYKSSERVESQLKLEPVMTTPKKRAPWLKPAFIALAGVLALGIVISIASFSKPEGKDTTAEFTPVPLPSAPTELQPKEANSVDSNSGVATPESSSESQAPVQNPATANPADTDSLKVQLTFTQKTWIVVNVDGQKAIEETFPEGSTKELTAKEKIELVTVGNAGGVSITLNGKPYPSLGSSGQVVRNVVLKKDTINQISFLP